MAVLRANGRRWITCDAPGCGATFEGPLSASVTAGWRFTLGSKSGTKSFCPAHIGLREAEEMESWRALFCEECLAGRSCEKHRY